MRNAAEQEGLACDDNARIEGDSKINKKSIS